MFKPKTPKASLGTQLQITALGKQRVEDTTNLGAGHSMLSYLELRGAAGAGTLINYVGLKEDEGRSVLNRLMRKRYIQIAGEEE